jgi:SPP1 gp7 family putative phage head morphogenesis protein
LAGLVKDFEELFLLEIGRSKGRALAAPLKKFTFDLAAYYASIDAIEALIDSRAAKPAAVTVSAAAIAHGRKWAEKNLEKMGVATLTPVYANAKPFFLPVEQKMVVMYEEKVLSEIKSLTSYQATSLKRAMLTSYSNGETIGQITRRVSEVTGKSISKSITIARTETLAAGNAAAKERYTAAGVETVEWVAALDDRVCPECEGKHGNVYPLDQSPDLPVHPNCRCTLVPVIEVEE